TLFRSDRLAAAGDYAGAQARLDLGLEKYPANFQLWLKAFKVSLAAADFEQASEFFAMAEKLADKKDAPLLTANEFQTFEAVAFFASFEKIVQAQREAQNAEKELRRQKELQKQQLEDEEDEEDEEEEASDDGEEDDDDESGGAKPEFIINYYMCRPEQPKENDRVIVYFGNRKEITVLKPPAPYNFYTFLVINRLSPYEMTVKYNEFDSDAPFKNSYFRAPLIMPAALKVPLPEDGGAAVPADKYAGLNRVKMAEFAEGITEIGDGAFMNCASLEEVKFPSTLKKIGARAFENCPALKSLNLPDELAEIGARAFKNCKELLSARLPDGLAELPDAVFSGCVKLNLKQLPPALTAIGAEAFLGCAAIVKAVLPETLTSVGDKAFSGCNSFSFSAIPAGIQKIGAYAFEGTMLEKANLIGKSPYVPIKPPAGPCDTFGVKVKNFGVMTGRACQAGWVAAVRLLNSKKSIRYEKREQEFALVENAEIGDGAFSNCKYLKEIHLGKIQKLGANVFANSAVRIYVELPDPLLPAGWDASWNGDNFGGKMSYYKKKGQGLSYKLTK
ncbi:MAG: leucine-rich repeat protein, partial [Clostridiales bacterium]|nr:leucine-rich repeat protein [Clostridiales bacterium]